MIYSEHIYTLLIADTCSSHILLYKVDIFLAISACLETNLRMKNLFKLWRNKLKLKKIQKYRKKKFLRHIEYFSKTKYGTKDRLCYNPVFYHPIIRRLKRNMQEKSNLQEMK